MSQPESAAQPERSLRRELSSRAVAKAKSAAKARRSMHVRYPLCAQFFSTVVIVSIYMVIGCLVYREGFGEMKECESLAALEAAADPDDCMEPWTIVDTLYFLMVSISTVGYGDFSPSSIGSRLFTIVYAVFGCTLIFYHLSSTLTIVITIITSLVRKGHSQGAAIDITGDGVADFVEPLSAPIFWLTELAPIVVLVIITQAAFAAFLSISQPGLDYGTAMYHCIITALTIGYGDITLSTQTARGVATVHIALSVSWLAAALNLVGQKKAVRKAQLQKSEVLRRQLDEELVLGLDQDPDDPEGGGVDKLEFVVGMLIMLGVELCGDPLSWDEVRPFLAKFDRIDGDGSGRISRDDLRLMLEEDRKKKGAAESKESSLHGGDSPQRRARAPSSDASAANSAAASSSAAAPNDFPSAAPAAPTPAAAGSPERRPIRRGVLPCGMPPPSSARTRPSAVDPGAPPDGLPSTSASATQPTPEAPTGPRHPGELTPPRTPPSPVPTARTYSFTPPSGANRPTGAARPSAGGVTGGGEAGGGEPGAGVVTPLTAAGGAGEEATAPAPHSRQESESEAAAAARADAAREMARAAAAREAEAEAAAAKAALKAAGGPVVADHLLALQLHSQLASNAAYLDRLDQAAMEAAAVAVANLRPAATSPLGGEGGRSPARWTCAARSPADRSPTRQSPQVGRPARPSKSPSMDTILEATQEASSSQPSSPTRLGLRPLSPGSTSPGILADTPQGFRSERGHSSVAALGYAAQYHPEVLHGGLHPTGGWQQHYTPQMAGNLACAHSAHNAAASRAAGGRILGGGGRGSRAGTLRPRGVGSVQTVFKV